METKEIEIFRLSEIIARSMREELSDDERRVLDEWLAQDERHRTMYAAFGPGRGIGGTGAVASND